MPSTSPFLKQCFQLMSYQKDHQSPVDLVVFSPRQPTITEGSQGAVADWGVVAGLATYGD